MSNIDLEKLYQGHRPTLARAITLTESKRDDHRQQAQIILEETLSHSGQSIRIGITGIPGVGKSTFIEAFGQYLISLGKKVAVLAVDPSSPVAGGSILGDKTRMELLSREDNAFIRPSPSEGSLGGVAHKTRETMLLCEAAGYDIILVETVGVGQSEYEVASMVDFFLVLMLPNAGDELQGIKKGILELADAIVINKADGESINLAKQTQQHYQNAFHLLRANSFWAPKVLSCSALEHHHIDVIWNMIDEYIGQSTAENHFQQKRSEQNRQWLQKLLQEMLEIKLNQNDDIKQLKHSMEIAVTQGSVTPYSAAKAIVDKL